LPLLFYAVVKDTSWRFLFKRRPGRGSNLCLASYRRRKSHLSPLRVRRASSPKAQKLSQSAT
jgi:hypothetical protein